MKELFCLYLRPAMFGTVGYIALALLLAVGVESINLLLGSPLSVVRVIDALLMLLYATPFALCGSLLGVLVVRRLDKEEGSTDE